jgi:hypothetical protein
MEAGQERTLPRRAVGAEGGRGALPFVNLNNDPEQDYFADAITTDLTTDLARMPGAFRERKRALGIETQRDEALRHVRGSAPRPVASPSRLGSNAAGILPIVG